MSDCLRIDKAIHEHRDAAVRGTKSRHRECERRRQDEEQCPLGRPPL